MINWFTLIKKLMQTSIVIVSGSIINASTVHLNGIWHLIWCYISKPVLGGHPVLSGHFSIPWGCPLNTGFTVVRIDWFFHTRSHHGNTCNTFASCVCQMQGMSCKSIACKPRRRISGHRLKRKNRMLSQASKSKVGICLADSWTWLLQVHGVISVFWSHFPQWQPSWYRLVTLSDWYW